MLAWIMLIEDEDDRTFVSELYRKYEKNMCATAYKVLGAHGPVDDCIHETVRRIADNIAPFKDAEANGKLAALVSITCKNVARNMQGNILYRSLNEVPLTQYYGDSDADGEHEHTAARDRETNVEDLVISRENVEYLSRLIDKLKPAYRDVVLLKAMGYSNDEIARLLKITPNNVRQRLFVAREKLLKMGGDTLYELYGKR